jgi:hypothetical protein
VANDLAGVAKASALAQKPDGAIQSRVACVVDLVEAARTER